MRARLIRTTGEFPPGGFAFNDPVTGKVYRESHYTFEDVVQMVIRNRNANRRLVTDPKQLDAQYVADQISEAICQRLDYNPRYCVGDGVNNQTAGMPRPTPTVPAGRKCVCGSTDLDVAICQSCGGKVVGLRCKTCGNEFR